MEGESFRWQLLYLSSKNRSIRPLGIGLCVLRHCSNSFSNFIQTSRQVLRLHVHVGRTQCPVMRQTAHSSAHGSPEFYTSLAITVGCYGDQVTGRQGLLIQHCCRFVPSCALAWVRVCACEGRACVHLPLASSFTGCDGGGGGGGTIDANGSGGEYLLRKRPTKGLRVRKNSK